jgi:hypothetical protein
MQTGIGTCRQTPVAPRVCQHASHVSHVCAGKRVFATIDELQAALDGWVHQYNIERPHQSLGMRPPAERFALAAPGPDPAVADPIAAVVAQTPAATRRGDLRHTGVQRWVDQRGSIRLAGFGYRVPIVLAGEPVQAVVADNLCRSITTTCWPPRMCSGITPTTHRGCCARAGARLGRRAPGSWSLAWLMPADAYRSPGPCTGPDGLGGETKSRFPSWPGSVQMVCEGTLVRTQPIRHDRAKEHGAFATPHGRPRKPRQDAPDRAGVKATPRRGRPQGRALTPAPFCGAKGA